MNEQMIRENYQRVIERITHSAHAAGRNPTSIQLVVITKTHPVEMINSVIDAGATDIGENYVEEALPKIQSLASDDKIRWHMVGHVQSRKASQVCRHFHVLHSLDSVKLAGRLSASAIELGKTMPVWLEFNVSGESSKSGWDIWNQTDWGAILPELEQVFSLPGLSLSGAMTIPPYSPDPEASRPHYQLLRKFQAYVIDHLKITGFDGLSIGMSADFEVAIQEGSTCVRIGQAILGPRS